MTSIRMASFPFVVYYYPSAAVLLKIFLTMCLYTIYNSYCRCTRAGCPSQDALLEPFFKEVETFNKNEGSKRGKISMANKSIAAALIDMDKWITEGNCKNGFGAMFLGFRDDMAKYELRLT